MVTRHTIYACFSRSLRLWWSTAPIDLGILPIRPGIMQFQWFCRGGRNHRCGGQHGGPSPTYGSVSLDLTHYANRNKIFCLCKLCTYVAFSNCSLPAGSRCRHDEIAGPDRRNPNSKPPWKFSNAFGSFCRPLATAFWADSSGLSRRFLDRPMCGISSDCSLRSKRSMRSNRNVRL